MLYAASDVFCIHPEHGFAGINSTAMRALDKGLVVVAPSDSVTARSASAYGRGAAFQRGDADSLHRVLWNVHKTLAGPDRGRPRKQESRVTVGVNQFGLQVAGIYQEIISQQQ
jgi:hypothetical protein